jgi:hypothetical protein
MYEYETIILCGQTVSQRGILSVPQSHLLTKELKGPEGDIKQRCYYYIILQDFDN